MTLHEAIEGLTRVREQKYQDAARLTIELEAMTKKIGKSI